MQIQKSNFAHPDDPSKTFERINDKPNIRQNQSYAYLNQEKIMIHTYIGNNKQNHYAGSWGKSGWVNRDKLCDPQYIHIFSRV